MAQLRDVQTSEFLFDGTPLQVAILAQKIGFDQVIFDDVGVDFDPQAVLDQHQGMIDSLPSDAPDEVKDDVSSRDSLPRGAIKAANEALAEARAAVDEQE